MGAVGNFKRDSSGLAGILKSAPVAAAVHAKAEQIAASVRASTGAEVVVDSYETDRAAASVTIRDVRGKWFQVRHGVLTRAAAQAGLDVVERSDPEVHDPYGRKMARLGRKR